MTMPSCPVCWSNLCAVAAEAAMCRDAVVAVVVGAVVVGAKLSYFGVVVGCWNPSSPNTWQLPKE